MRLNSVDWIHLAQDKTEATGASYTTAMNPHVPFARD
jgi:hypothetical protein